MNQPQKRRLGRGLAALIEDEPDAPPEEARGLRLIPIEHISPSRANPRRVFGETELDELAVSIRRKGVLQPLLVRPGAEGGYEIVAGERRWRAAQRAQLHEVPAIVRALSDGEALEFAIIENVQRADLNPIEEAQGYRQLIEHFGHTQQELADVVGKSRSHVANTLRLLSLPKNVRSLLESGELSAGHARALVAIDDPVDLARRIVADGLSVREAERLAKSAQGKDRTPVPAAPPEQKSADLRALERELEEATGLKAEIAHHAAGHGRVTLAYGSLEQLDDIRRRLIRRT